VTVKSRHDTLRHARMPINSAIFMMHGGESWSSEMVDISATGVMVRRPFDWRGALGDHYVLDMVIGPSLNIHLEAVVARVTDWHVGFAYERIPADREAPLWNLLGSYADAVETVAS
jgi:PilZ domain-containing protein